MLIPLSGEPCPEGVARQLPPLPALSEIERNLLHNTRNSAFPI